MQGQSPQIYNDDNYSYIHGIITILSIRAVIVIIILVNFKEKSMCFITEHMIMTSVHLHKLFHVLYTCRASHRNAVAISLVKVMEYHEPH